MNIESSNLINALPGATVMDGAAPVSPVDGAIAEVFGDTFKVQLQLLAESSINQATVSQAAETLIPSTQVADVQGIADVLGKDLPVSYQLNDKDDAHAALNVVTDSLKYLKAGEASASSVIEQMTPVINAQQIQQQANADTPTAEQLQADAGSAVNESLQVNAEAGQLQAKASKSGVRKEGLQQNQDAGNQEDQVAQMVLMPGIEIAQLPVNSVPNEGAAAGEAEQLASVKPFSANANGKPMVEMNQTKGDEQQKTSGQDKLALFGAVLNKQGSATGKIELVDQAVATGSNVDIKVAGTAVNGQFDKTIIEAKTEVPALTRPLTHPEWNKDLGERIVWMNNRALPAAEIKLNPQHLGPVSVRIDMNQDQASIVFTAQHAVVREALEASVPKLREMLNDQQINLVNVSVAQNGNSEQRNSQPQTFNQAGGEAVVDAADEVGITEHERVTVSNGLLNMYA